MNARLVYLLNIFLVFSLLAVENPLADIQSRLGWPAPTFDPSFRAMPSGSDSSGPARTATPTQVTTPAPTQPQTPKNFLPVLFRMAVEDLTPTLTPSAVGTLKATVTPLATNSPGSTPSMTPMSSPTSPPVLTPGPTFTATATPTPIHSPTPTSTPTDTPTPSDTPTDTPTPTPTFQSLPEVFVESNHSYYLDIRAELHIVGEVINNSIFNLQRIRVSVNHFDENDQLVDTNSNFTYAQNLPAGDKTCFEIIIPSPSPSWTSYAFEAPTFRTDGHQYPLTTLMNVSAAYIPGSGNYEILGEVRNDHGSLVEFVRPVGTVYDVGDTVVGCGQTLVNTIHLDPGQTSAFKIGFQNRDYQDVTSYHLQVDGDLP